MRINNCMPKNLAAVITPPVFAVWALLLSSIFLGVTLSLPANAANEKQSTKVPADVEKSKPYQRWKWFYDQRAYPSGDIPAGANARALKQIKEAKEKSKTLKDGSQFAPLSSTSTNLSSTTSSSSAIAGDRWIPIGPAPIDASAFGSGDVSGRVTDIAVDPADTNHWFVAFGTGGLWETRDAGITWIAKIDDQATQAVGAVAIAPSNPNIIYAGTGDPHGWMGWAGEGLLKSTDGGNTWQLLGTAEFSKVAFSEIQVDPHNPDIVVATIVQNDPNMGFNTNWTGVVKSTDGGATWRNTLGYIGWLWAAELAVSRTNFNQQYAVIITNDRSLNGLYRSTDAGESWTLVGGPWVGQADVIDLDIAPSNPNVMYTLTNKGVVWRTDNAFAAMPSWTQVASVDNGYNSQWWYYHTIIVDPIDPLTAYFGGMDLWRINGNTVLADLGGGPGNFHVDQHRLTWAGGRLIIGNDGGVYSSSNPGAATPTWNNHNAGLPTVTFYHGSLHAQNAGFALGASQDNGTEKWTGSKRWLQIGGSDGMDNAISTTNPDTHWAISSQLLNIDRTLDGGQSYSPATAGIDMSNAPFNGVFEKCPLNDDVFLAGTDNLWRSDNFFNNSGPQWSTNGPEMPQGITAIAFASATGSCNTYAFASVTRLQLTTDGGSTWIDINPWNSFQIPARNITDIAFDPNNANVMYVTLSGYDEGSPNQPGHVFKTTNALAASPTWTNVSPPVNTPHNTMIVDPNDPNTLYVGTDLGIWKSTDAGANWIHMGIETGMPNVPVSDLQVNGSTGKIAAFTYGRSAFMLAAPVDLVTTAVVVPSRIAPGTSTTLSNTVCNQGHNASTGVGFNVDYYLSSDAQITSSDTHVGTRTIAGLAANSCDSGGIPWAVSANQPQGTFYIGAIADAGNLVVEANESNNALAHKFLVTTNSDLVVMSITPPATLEPGTTTGILVQVKNQGSGSTGQGFNVTVYLRDNGGNMTLLGSALLSALAADSFADVSIPATLPTSLGASNSYAIYVVIDNNNQVEELDENNNTSQSSLISLSTGADLTVSAITAPNRAAPGDAIGYSTTVCNNGSGAAGAFLTFTYLSSDTVIDAADTVLDVTYNQNGLAANTCNTFTMPRLGVTPATIPINQAPGVNYIITHTDMYNWVPETSENNNIEMAAILIDGPDLVMTSVSTTASSLTIGGSAPFSTSMMNQGTGPTTVDSYYGIYLSTDATITTADTLINYWWVAPGFPSTGGQQVSGSFSIPSTLTPGKYYLGAIADYTSSQPESNETNNAFTGNLIDVIAAPTVTTNPASSITEKCATLNGAINPNNAASTARFEWGTTTAYDNQTAIQTVASGTTPVAFIQQVCGLTPNTAYNFRAFGQNAAGQGYGGIQTVTTLPDTTAPTTPTLTAAGNAGRVDLSWTASTDNVGVVSYHIERCAGKTCTNFALLTSVLFPGTSYRDTAVVTGTTYSYRTRAKDVGGNYSTYSGTAKATPTADTTVPSAPTGLTATTAGMTQTNLAWTASTDNVGVSGYKIERCTGATCTTFVQVATSTTNSYSDIGLNPGTTYRYQVRAYDAAGNTSAPSTPPATATTQSDPVAPGATSGLTATTISSTQINLGWTAATDNVGVTGYKIERCTGVGCSNFAQIATSTTISYSNTGLSSSTTYCYRVRAYDATGNNGAYSSTVCSATLIQLTATVISNSQINLSWSPLSGMTGYKIERCTGAGCTNFAQIATSTTASYNNTGLAAKTTYVYRVRAYDAAGSNSAYSNSVSAVTPR